MNETGWGQVGAIRGDGVGDRSEQEGGCGRSGVRGEDVRGREWNLGRIMEDETEE